VSANCVSFWRYLVPIPYTWASPLDSIDGLSSPGSLHYRHHIKFLALTLVIRNPHFLKTGGIKCHSAQKTPNYVISNKNTSKIKEISLPQSHPCGEKTPRITLYPFVPQTLQLWLCRCVIQIKLEYRYWVNVGYYNVFKRRKDKHVKRIQIATVITGHSLGPIKRLQYEMSLWRHNHMHEHFLWQCGPCSL